MKRVELLARLKTAQQHDLIRGRDITTLTAFMNNTALEEHVEHFEQIIEDHRKKAQGGSFSTASHAN
ncbi:hypothetical protein [Pseudaminobacter salicylatoxidans]|uniref:hypothetical protein n=1 Tax=Pseudaminobacter salicylatoxidans TaxID=93369 RepID=UPI0002F79FE3|nr:hypothetical protein [Pseudaminobacter salicylatoxidans]